MVKRWRSAAAVISVLFVAAGCSLVQTDGQARQSEQPVTGVPTVVVLDASDSMHIEDAPGARWDAAKHATEALAGALPDGTDFALVAFGAQHAAAAAPPEIGCQDVQVLVPNGPVDTAQVAKALNGVTPQGYTPMANALQTAVGLLPDTEASLVVVSDGEANCAPDPCETAKNIRSAKPKTTISAVGFRTDAPSLQCVAIQGGGVFLTAENAEQLTARLAAAQNAEAAGKRLSPTGLADAQIGDSLAQVARANPGFPADGRTDGDRLIIVWKDCTYVFDGDRTLVEIAPGASPGEAGVTIDGVQAGTRGSRARELYGDPVADGDGVATFVADKAAGTGYRIGYRDGSTIDDGTVTTVVLCRCAGQDSQPKLEPVLGRDKFERYAVGFGTTRPESISIASTAASSVGDITWSSWGGADAYGTGMSQQNGAGNPMSKTYLRATDLGWCDGAWAYRGLRRTGSEATLAGPDVEDICQGDRSEPAAASSSNVALGPDSRLTFGGAGGVYLGDSSSKIPDTYIKKDVVDAPGLYPLGTELFYFRQPLTYPGGARIEAQPDGRIVRFTWNETDKGVKAGASRADVQRAYAGYPSGTCTLYGPKSFADIYTDPATGRYLLAVYSNSDEGVATFMVIDHVQNGKRCPFE